MREWGVNVNDAFFLGGIEKSKVLKVLRPHIFFDDQRQHLDTALDHIAGVHIPYGVANAGNSNDDPMPTPDVAFPPPNAPEKRLIVARNCRERRPPMPADDAARARVAVPEWYQGLFTAMADRIDTGHRRAVAAANAELVVTYWAIGREILDRQEREGWGTRSSTDCRPTCGSGSRTPRATRPRNLKYMRAFAAAWPDPAIVQARACTIAVVPSHGCCWTS